MTVKMLDLLVMFVTPLLICNMLRPDPAASNACEEFIVFNSQNSGRMQEVCEFVTFNSQASPQVLQVTSAALPSQAARSAPAKRRGLFAKVTAQKFCTEILHVASETNLHVPALHRTRSWRTG